MSPVLMVRVEFVRLNPVVVLMVKEAIVRLPFRSRVVPEVKALPRTMVSPLAGKASLSQLRRVSQRALAPPPSQVRVALSADGSDAKSNPSVRIGKSHP